MDYDIILGIVLLAVSLSLLTCFTIISRNRINKIKKAGPDTARNILKDLENEK